MKRVVFLAIVLGLAALLLIQLGLYPGGAPLSSPEGKEAASNIFFMLCVLVAVAWLMRRSSERKAGARRGGRSGDDAK